jgi:ubiquinone/menaquinone biosynthesis C-methylase UbiE
MDRKQYMKEVYSKYWITARENIYGFSPYDRNLCEYLRSKVPHGAKVLEVAVGTGYPFADILQKTGYSVFGIDLSLDLIKKCNQTNSKINCAVADAEDLPFANAHFSCTYCFHSTWYFPDLSKALSEMLRVTESPGLVVFDIQNRNSVSIDRAYRFRVAEGSMRRTLVRWAKNMTKIILRHGTPVWRWVVHEVPADPRNIYDLLEGKAIGACDVFGRQNGQIVELMFKRDSLNAEFDRLIFVKNKADNKANEKRAQNG